ncbi:MAG: site-2 protease family protein [Candidatus ainarchaeum sp.]|nr:site-2 protease family protein [Candidatus ainarchaeum sp.]
MGYIKHEILHIFIAWIVISLAFAWQGFSNFSAFYLNLPIVLLAAGTGFIVHELSHKFVAIHYDAKARFVMWPYGLVFAVALALISGGGFVFAAPGAVYIWGKDLSRKESGIISVAGPVSNLVIAILVFVLSLIIFQFYISQFLVTLFYTIISVNLFLGLFNLLPIPPLDGYKVLVWNKPVWAVLLVIFIAALIYFW